MHALRLRSYDIYHFTEVKLMLAGLILADDRVCLMCVCVCVCDVCVFLLNA